VGVRVPVRLGDIVQVVVAAAGVGVTPDLEYLLDLLTPAVADERR